jgi:hypothetical protein
VKSIKFDPKEKRLCYIGYILNLITEEYLFKQDYSTFKKEFKKAGAPEQQALWRRRREIRKLHNLVAHIIALGKRTDLFLALQNTFNISVAAGKRWKLVLDGGIRWNASYAMITRALQLREALDTYALKLHASKDSFDQETYMSDYLSDNE